MEFEILYSSILEIVLTVLFSVVSLFLTVFYIVKFGKVRKYRAKTVSEEKKPVSVIITAKNEHEYLKQNLPFFLQQNYPQFEIVVVVIDESDDDTFFLLRNFETKYSNLKVVNFEKNVNFFRGKKFPLAIGIKSASYENVLISSPECRPLSENWISEMQQGFVGKKEIVIGYQSYFEKKTLFNRFVRYDNFQNALKYMSSAISRKPYTGTITNVGYTRSLFYNSSGVPEFYNIETGTDDLFVCKAATPQNVFVQLSPDSFMKSEEIRNFSGWFEKKRQHNNVSHFYKEKIQRTLAMFNILTYLFYLSFFALFATPIFYNLSIVSDRIKNYEIVILFLLIKIITQFVIYRQCMNRLKEHNFLIFVPFFELLMLILQPFFFLARVFHKKTAWK